jgi:DNA modification methylase
MKHYVDDWLTIYQGDVRAVLPELASDSVDCIVTSPPYWGLRDYGSDGQIGLERTPEEYVANLVAVFRELRRVLKPSGTCWLNLGDSYAANGQPGQSNLDVLGEQYRGGDHKRAEVEKPRKQLPTGLKPKDLVGIPWRVAFALQADGWYLRSDIIWAKPNPMPESVTDRPTKAHEYLFLLTKSARYYYDADAVREANLTNLPVVDKPRSQNRQGVTPLAEREADGWGSLGYNPAGRNLRSVWTIATRPYPGAHFAVFPPELPERCIKAGSSERGVCPDCGKPWERMTEKGEPVQQHRAPGTQTKRTGNGKDSSVLETGMVWPRETVGWCRSCPEHVASSIGLVPEPAVVLDPFAGSGTTGMVANRLSRRAILIDLNGDYLKQQLKRNAQTPLGLGA